MFNYTILYYVQHLLDKDNKERTDPMYYEKLFSLLAFPAKTDLITLI